MVATRRIFPEEAVQAPFEWARLERLGEEVSQLVFRRDLAQPYVTAPDRLVSKVLRMSTCFARSRPPRT
jgi:hypothetical protein